MYAHTSIPNNSSQIFIFISVLSSIQSRLHVKVRSSATTSCKKSLWTSVMLGIVNFDFDLVWRIVIINLYIPNDICLIATDCLRRNKPDVYAIGSHRDLEFLSTTYSYNTHHCCLNSICRILRNHADQMWDLNVRVFQKTTPSAVKVWYQRLLHAYV